MEENRIVSAKRKSFVLSEEPVTTTPKPSTEIKRESEKEVDEQMERFYALLENIKAMRHTWVGGSGNANSKKMKVDNERTTGYQEVPWRPTFRLEDFMQGEGSKITEQQKVKKEHDCGAERSDES